MSTGLDQHTELAMSKMLMLTVELSLDGLHYNTVQRLMIVIDKSLHVYMHYAVGSDQCTSANGNY